MFLSAGLALAAAPSGQGSVSAASLSPSTVLTVPQFIGGTELAGLSDNVAAAVGSASTVLLAASTDPQAVAQANANAAQLGAVALAGASSTNGVLAQLSAVGPDAVSLVGAPADFSTELTAAVAAQYALDDVTYVSDDPVQWALATHDSAYRQRLIIGDGAVAHSPAYAAALAIATDSSLVLIDATHNIGLVPLVTDTSNGSVTVLGDYSSFSELQDLDEATVDKITNIPLDDLAAASLSITRATIGAGASAKRLVASNADDPATLGLAARYAVAIGAVVTDRANATSYLSLLRSVPTSTTLVGVGATSSGGTALAGERPTPTATPAFRVTDTTATTASFTVVFTALPGAASYTAYDEVGTEVTTSTSASVTASGTPYDLAITATNASGQTLATLQYKVNGYQTTDDRPHVVVASTSGEENYLKFLGPASLPRLITRTAIPITGGIPDASATVSVAITCEPDYTDSSQPGTSQYDCRVYTLSNDPATCETTGTVGDATTLTTAGALFPPTELPMSAAASTSLAAAIAATPDGPAATQSILQKVLNAARGGTASSSSGMSTMVDGDGWTPIAFRYQTFIPNAKIGSPGFSGDIARPYIAFNGNDRGFDPAGDYKTREDVLVTFGTGHSITTLTRAVGTTHRYKCTWPWLASCVETNSATASSDGLAINRVVSTNTGGAFTFHVSAANPLQSVAPPISADLRITMAPHNTWLTGRHDNMPLHEVYLEFPEWENEWYYAYQSRFYDPVCLAGQLPGCSTWINIPL